MNTTKKAAIITSIALLLCVFSAVSFSFAQTQTSTEPLNQDALTKSVVAQVHNGILQVDFQLTSNSVASLPITWAVTLQDPTHKVIDMMSATGANLTPTPQHMRYISPTMPDINGTWTATIQVFKTDGTTGLGVTVVNFTL